MDVHKKRFSILGLGKTGAAAALFLRKKGAEVFVSEKSTDTSVQKIAEKLQKKGIEVELGDHSLSQITKSDFILVSPGISPHTPLMKELETEREKWLSDIELASWFCRGRIIAITGTNGKTTVTTLLRDLLKAAGLRVFQGGNIGTPFVEIAEKVGLNGFAVLELSSFQLYYTQTLKPFISVVLNIAPDHFDWHRDFDEYADAKMKVYENQDKEDFALLNEKEIEIQKRFSNEAKGKRIYFNHQKITKNPNVDCLRIIASILGIKEKVFRSVVLNFKGIEHRMEWVCVQGGITYINDSKSTSLHSLEWALEKFPGKVILICGGRNKGLDFTKMRHLVQKKVKSLISIGECREEISQAFSDVISVTQAEELSEAVQKSREMANEKDVVLFSPACASFDMFQNYEDRGRQFKKIVKNLRKVM